MSYGGYPASNHNYSPYFEQPAGQDGHTQYSDQSKSNDTYQTNAYQPLNAYQSNPQPQSSAPQSSNSGTAYSHQDHGSTAVTERSQDSRAGYTDNRASVDTTALGNLAYASSLGRDSSLQQIMNYNRAQGNPDYGSSAPYGINSAQPIQYTAGHTRTDSTNSTATSKDNSHARAQPATSSPSFGYSSNSGNIGYQAQPPRAGGTGQARPQNTGSQPSRTAAEQYRLSQHNTQPSRPTSGQSVQHPQSKIGSQGPQSPTVSAPQSASNQSTGQYRGEYSGTDRSHTPQTNQQSVPRVSTGPQAGTYAPNASSQKLARNSAQHTSGTAATNTQAGTHTSSNKSPHSEHAQARIGRQSNTDSQASGRLSQNSPTETSTFPTTVNPSQVFNNVEYQRRQVAAAAEVEAAKKKANNARIAAQPKEPTPSNIPTSNQPGGSLSASASSDADFAKKDQMELEMRQMIEKMRDYKSKDASLFSQIWEQVKKGQPPQRASHAAPQRSSASPIVINDQLPSPSVQLPPESELPAAEAFPDGFDRGRFPAQRRRRGGASANFTPPMTAATPKGSSKPSLSSTTHPGNQTMRNAMEEFHRNSNSPIPSTSHTGPTTKEIQPTSSTSTAPKSSSMPTPSTTASLTQPPKAGGTYWPENKKRALAEAARIALTSTLSNAGKDISTKEIHELLDRNPSYTQMCEILEFRGFVIDRGQFARLLLSAVPDLGSTAKTPAKTPATLPAKPPLNGLPTPSTAAPPPPSHTTRPGRPLPFSAPQNRPNPVFVTPSTPPHASRPPGQPGSQQPYQAPQNSIHYPFTNPTPNPAVGVVPAGRPESVYTGHGILYPGAPLPPHPSAPTTTPSKNGVRWADNSVPHRTTKQDMARKRSFGEIVDLTQGPSDDDDMEPPNKRPRVDNGVPHQPTPASTEESLKEDFEKGAERATASGTATPLTVKDGKPSINDFRVPSTKAELLSSKDIIRPMNKRQDALRRSTYNPKTIARDVLVAIGKHPTMAPLNSHLDVLRDRFRAVNNDSDLSTFRWDLVDPGGPPPVDPDDSISTTQRPSTAIVIGGSRGSGIVQDAGSSQPRGKGSRLTRGGHATPFARPRPGIPGSSVHKQQTPQQIPASSQANNYRARNDSDLSRFVYNDLPVMLNNITGAAFITPTAQLSQSGAPSSRSVPGKRGRPAGAKNKVPRPDKGISTKARHNSQNHQGAPVGTPNSVSNSARPRIGTTPVRPSGLGTAMKPADGIAVVVQSRSPSVVDASQSSPALSFAKKIRPIKIPASTPSYRVYKCHWDKCPAELHNLETLRKHLGKHRDQKGFEDGPVPCLWDKCFSRNVAIPHIPDVNANYARERLTFKTEAAWIKHMEGKHVNAVAYDLGDGPSMHLSDSDSSDVKDKSRSQQHTPNAKTKGRSDLWSATPASKATPRPMIVLPR